MMKTVFFIYSPFQAICTFEAIEKFNISEPVIFCMGGNYLVKNSKTPLLLKELGLSFNYINTGPHFKRVFNLYRYHNQYERCFIGDYFNPDLRFLAAYFLKRKGELYYLDDGASTITAFRSKYPLLKSSLRVKLQYVFPAIMSFFKGHTGRFFSIFDIPDGIKNDLSAIKKRFSQEKEKKDGIFIIGTTYKGFKSPETFFPLLKETIKIFCNTTEPLFYSPHRAAVNDEMILKICNENGVNYIIGEYCVEVDYLNNNYNPSVIIGFGSTALFTLKRIFNESKIVSIKYPAVMVQGNESTYDAVNEYLKEAGVEIVTIIK